MVFNMDEKVIIVELDGATWDIIDPMISRGELPNFKRLKAGSVYAELNTSYWSSPHIWTAIFTGKKKEKFGMPFFGINRARLEAKRLWEIAAERGLRVGIVHSLLTWPPGEVDGFVIPDVFAMGPETYPRKYQYLQKLYLSRHNKNLLAQGYFFLRSFLSCGSLDVVGALFKLLLSSLFHPGILNTFQRRLMVVIKLDHNLFPKLYKRHRPQLSTFHLHALDTVSHKYWQYMSKPGICGRVIHDFYREADRFIGRVFKLLDGHTSLVVLSDHGFQTQQSGTRGAFQLNVRALRELLSLGTTTRVVRFGDAFVLNMGGGDQGMDADWLTEELASAKLRDGSSLFTNVKKIDGNIHFRLPNRLLKNQGVMEEVIFFREVGEVVFSDLFRRMAFENTGMHAPGKGIFAVHGRKFMQNTNIQKVQEFDITPTLLALLDLPVAKDMDGDVDRRWFKPEVLKSLKPRYIDSYETGRREEENLYTEVYTQQEVEDLEERLKMLGYL